LFKGSEETKKYVTFLDNSHCMLCQNHTLKVEIHPTEGHKYPMKDFLPPVR